MKYEIDPKDGLPFTIIAEFKLNEVGWEKDHTQLVANLLRKLYHTCSSTKIDMDNLWQDYIRRLEKDLEGK